MARIAIVHFTGPPAIGGVEALIVGQTRALRSAGHDVRLILGSGSIDGVETCRLPFLDPAAAEVRIERERYRDRLPSFDHPLARALSSQLEEALGPAGQVWVHNAFTVFLNPFLTVALRELASRPDTRRWVAWCEDDTNLSRFQTPMTGSTLPAGVELVTISQARRTSLAARFVRSADSIAVVEPPLIPEDWLCLGTETREIVARAGLTSAGVVTITPAKLLPHKNLERAIALAAALRDRVPAPLVLITGAESAHEPDVSVSVASALRQSIDASGLRDNVVLIRDVLGRPPSSRTVRELLTLADALFLPSLEEGYGMPLVEAALLRVPTICFDLPVVREIASEWACILPVQASDDAVAEAVLTVAGRPANAARRRALRSWRRFHRQIETLASGLGNLDVIRGPVTY